MAVQNSGNVFVVRERLESLEARIETALDEAGLRDFTKQVAKEAMSELVAEIVEELQSRKSQVLDQVHLERVDVDDRLKQTESKFDVAIVDHVTKLETSLIEKFTMISDRIDRIESLVKLSLVGSLVAIALSLFV